MDPKRWRQVKQLFAAASQVPAEQRQSFLQRFCPDDADLRSYISRLLTSREKADSFFEDFGPCLPAVSGDSNLSAAWSAMEDLFARGLLLPEEEREPLLQGVSARAADTLRALWAVTGKRVDRVLAEGDRIGRFEVIRLVGAGGMGEVYLARDPDLARNVAIKVLPAVLAEDPERSGRLRREARAVSALKHPNIITVHELGVDQGRTFLVTEFIEGHTLKETLCDGPLGKRQPLSRCKSHKGFRPPTNSESSTATSNQPTS